MSRRFFVAVPFHFFWTAAGVKVDLVAAGPERHAAMEIQFSKTVHFRMGAGLRNFRRTFPGSDCVLACLQPESFPLGEGVRAQHWWYALEWMQGSAGRI
ncbi:hypothetical protein JW906_05465 [bacterium]|nr:hypothetical protein [bacterium]